MSQGTSRLRFRQLVSDGHQSKVFRAHDTETRSTVAVKVIYFGSIDRVPVHMVRETSFLKSLSHPNIIRLIDQEEAPDRKSLYLILEWMQTDLKHFLATRDRVPPSRITWMMFDILNGLYCCHLRRVIHRDIKPDNIFLDFEGRLKLADFGKSCSSGSGGCEYTEPVQAANYRAPELLLGVERYSNSIDIWSVGCVFYEMAVGHPPFQGSCEETQLQAIFRVCGTPTEESWPGVTKLPRYPSVTEPIHPLENLSELRNTLGDDGVELLMLLLTVNPEERISASSALQHSFFLHQ